MMFMFQIKFFGNLEWIILFPIPVRPLHPGIGIVYFSLITNWNLCEYQHQTIMLMVVFSHHQLGRQMNIKKVVRSL